MRGTYGAFGTSSGLAGTPDETGTLIRYFILTFIDRN